MDRMYSSLLLLPVILTASTSDMIRDSVQGEVRWETSGPYGGTGGPRLQHFTDWWESLDGFHYFPTQAPDQVNIRAGGRVDSMQLFYGGKPGGQHGGQGGQLHRLRLYSGDRVTRVTGRAGLGPGASLDQVTLHTARGRTLGPFGGGGGVPFDTGDWGRYSCSLGYISGWAGARLDSVSFHWRCPPKAPQYEVVEGLGGHHSGAVAGAQLAWGALVVGALVLLL